MKGPVEAGEPAAARYAGGSRGVTGKALLRRSEFLEQRGLSGESAGLTLGEYAGRPDPGAGGGRSSVNEGPGRASAPREAEDLTEAPSAYSRAVREKEAILAAAAPEAVRWRSLGPAGIPRGQTYGSGPGSTATMAGRVAAIAVDPGNPGHILVGAAAGGVWQTHDGGQNWAPQTDDLPTLSIGALAFDPSDPSTVYAGTGEGNSEYFNLGQGILVSRDGGTKWLLVAREVFGRVGFYRLVVDPRDGRRLMAATTGGAAISADGGTRWSLLHRGLTWDVSLAYRGDEGEILLAAPDGLFAATGNAGFARVALPGLPAALDPNADRMAVTHVQADPGQAFAFAAAQGRAHLWHRPAAGQPFVSVALPSFPIPPYVEDILDVGQASYDWYVAVPPGSADVVYLGAIELVKGQRTGGGWLAAPAWNDISSRRRVGDSIHPDQHTIAFDAHNPNVIYAGNDGGIFRSPDAGNTWQSLNAGLAISEVEYLAQRPDDPRWILAGLQDNGTIRRESDQGWAQVALGDGGDCGTNMAHPDTCYHSYYFMNMERSSSRGDRDSWEDVTPPNSTPDQFKQLFYPPVEVNDQVVVKAGEVVCLSSDNGTTWAQVALPPAAAGKRSITSALAIPATDRVLAGTIRGDIFRIDRGQQGWGKPVKLAKPRDGWTSDLLVDPNVPQRYWATYSTIPGSVHRSDDGGTTWTNVTGNLPAIPVNAIVSDPSEPDRVWVACDVGVFESRDAGATWSVYGTGLPNALAEDLVLYQPGRLLRVGTRSRGVWEATVS